MQDTAPGSSSPLDLEPCPFDGTKIRIGEILTGYFWWCSTCNICSNNFKTREEAVAHANRRLRREPPAAPHLVPEGLDLAPCPFCGSELTSLEVAHYGPGGETPAGYFVDCKKCGSMGPFHVEKEGAVAMWNRRLIPPPPHPAPAKCLICGREANAEKSVNYCPQHDHWPAPAVPVAPAPKGPEEEESADLLMQYVADGASLEHTLSRFHAYTKGLEAKLAAQGPAPQAEPAYRDLYVGEEILASDEALSDSTECWARVSPHSVGKMYDPERFHRMRRLRRAAPSPVSAPAAEPRPMKLTANLDLNYGNGEIMHLSLYKDGNEYLGSIKQEEGILSELAHRINAFEGGPIPGGSDIRGAAEHLLTELDRPTGLRADPTSPIAEWFRGVINAADLLRCALQKDQDGSALASPTRSASEIREEVTICYGCGTDGRETFAPPALSCCPERKIVTVHQAARLAAKENLKVRDLIAAWIFDALARSAPEPKATGQDPTCKQLLQVPSSPEIPDPSKGAPGAGELEAAKWLSQGIDGLMSAAMNSQEKDGILYSLRKCRDILARSTPQQGREWELRGFADADHHHNTMTGVNCGPVLKLGETVRVRMVEAPEQKDPV